MKKLLSLTLVILMLFSTVSINVSASTTPSDWAVNEVNNAKNAGIITNAITKNYQKDITREEFCELVVKLYEKLTNKSATVGTDVFTDTDNQEILKAYNLGIVKGVSSNQFAPYNNITRQEICVMLTRCIDIAIDGSDITIFKTNSFADRNKIANWAVDSVDYAFDNSIIKGVGENKVDPLGNTTCEQAILLAYRIFANRNSLVVFDNLEENDLRDLFSVKEKINTSVNEYTNSEGKININSLDTVINKVADVSKELKENNEILDYNKDENTVWLKLNSGLQFVYVPEIEGYDLGGNNISIMTYQPFNSDYGTERPGSGDMERGIEATDGSAQNISNKFGKYSFTQNYDDGQVTLDSLKQIGSNQIILWHGHGGYNSSIHSFLGIGEELDETKFLWDPVYYVKNMKYTGDYLSGRIVCLSSGNIGVTSKFFTKYLPQMSNTFVYLGTCESAHDSVLVDSFINKGATTVIGNSATIYTQYNQKMIKSTCDGLMMKNSNSQYNTILEAQNYAKSLHGNTDGSKYNATPVIYGNQSLRLSHEQDSELLADFSFDNTVSDSANSVQVYGNGDYSFENGINGKCIYLDGDGDFLDLGNDYQLPENFTFNAWVKSENEDRSDAAIFAKYETNWYGPYDFYLSYNRPAFWISNGNGGYDEFISETKLSSNKWYMITYVKNENNLKIYVNGNLDLSVDCYDITTNNDTVTIGRQSLMFSPYSDLEYKGYIDELKIFNSALTQSEISDLYREYDFENEESKYELFDESMTWEEAKIYCENLGGHLATITSEEEQKIIEKLICEGSKYQYWLGATENGHEGKWTWITGETLEYTNWCPAQPDNYEKDSMYLQIINKVDNKAISSCVRYSWNDITNQNISDKPWYFSTEQVGFICEWD